MDNQESLEEIIKEHPIGTGLDSCRTYFKGACQENNVPNTLDALEKLDNYGKIATYHD